MQFARKYNYLAVAAATIGVMLFAFSNASAQKKYQISGTAMGTNQQLGRVISVDIHINKLSTPADREALIEAFTEDGSQGLANALDKMSSKGRISVTGTLGFDLNYIRVFKMPDGSRKLRFITDRPISFAEHWGSTRSMDYSLSMGEIIIPAGKGKKTGMLMPVAKFKINKQKEIEIENYQNPWKLVNIKVWD